MPLNKDDSAQISRRGFFKSLFPLLEGSVQGRTLLVGSFQPSFIWADLRTGQIGFPLGLARTNVLPGSLIHVVAAAALLEEALIDSNKTATCLQGRRCAIPHGAVDLAHAIALGCNEYFAGISHLLSTDLFLRYCADFGLNCNLGKFASGAFPINQPGSAEHLLNGNDTSFRPTATQLLRLAAVIASSGKLPALHSAEETASGPEPISPKFASTTWQFLRDSMHLSCLSGANSKLDPEPILDTSACSNILPFGTKYAVAIIGFFPYAKPIYAFYAAQEVVSEDETVIPVAQKYLFAQPWP